MKKRKALLTVTDAVAAMQRYCVYQDRCHKEVRTRLLEHQVYGHDLEEVMTALILDDFLNEERYARSFVRGKFRMNKWGKNKIVQHLKFNNVSPYCIKKGLSEIDDDLYMETIKGLIKRKNEGILKADIYTRKRKITSYLVQKGYEMHIISELLQEYFFAEK